MNIWSQIARLGAAVAAFGPPVLTEAADEPDQVTIPALGVTDQPVAGVVMQSREVPAEPLEIEVVGVVTDPYVAALPADTAVPAAPDAPVRQPRGGRAKADSKPHEGPRPGPHPWHGGGQR